MALLDVLADVAAGKKDKKTAEKKYVQFTIEEWRAMEEKQGSEIEPVEIKKLIKGIFDGRYTVSVAKKA